MLHSLEEIDALVASRPEKTRTYQLDPTIAPEVIRKIQDGRPNNGLRLRTMNPAEADELARYLEVPATEFHGPFTVSDIRCHGCGRHLTMLDVAKTGVDTGLHLRTTLAQVLTGRFGQWLTVRGQDGGRYADCAACGQKSPYPFEEYGEDYNYMWA